MNYSEFNKFIRIIIRSTKKYGFKVKRNDKKYLVLENIHGHIVIPKIKSDEFVRIFIVEYGEHIVRQFKTRAYRDCNIYFRFMNQYNIYFNEKNANI